MSYSVVIPLYNHERFIAEAIESVLTQSLPPREIIIIDDGSKDDSLNIARRLAQTNPEIMVLSQENMGAHVAINKGLAIASSPYVAILNSDDTYGRGRFQKLVQLLNEDEDLFLVGSNIQFIDENSTALPDSPWFTKAKLFHAIVRSEFLSLVYANYFMTTSNFLFRKELLADIGHFSDHRYCHDLNFLLRCARLGKKTIFYPERLLNYRFHGKNTVKEGIDKVLSEALQVIDHEYRQCSPLKRMAYQFAIPFICRLNGTYKYFINLKSSKTAKDRS